ncbi:ATPase [Novosphingobium sp. ZN18A2]|uniref:F0F1 ATP synthase subunit B family protein n=1 Tax=Novosphingobium sp. ZN18A2 TaxID=3079861 RepID=UPI0030D519A8
MPQFDFAHVFLPQFAWLAVFFAVLYFFVVRATLPKLGKVMTARDDKVAGDIEAASAAKAAADEVDERYHRELEAARENARQVIADAKTAGTKAGEARLAAAHDAADAEIAAAEARIADAVAKASEQLRDVAAESAQQIVSRLTGMEASQEAARAKVDAVLGA